MTDAALQLRACCEALELALTGDQHEQLLNYIELLARWNKAFNLTAVRDPEAMVSRHIADSLAVLPYLHGDTVLDVGSGAGLPGIPLAIADPRRRFTLLDSNGKKVRFLRQAVMTLGLETVEPVKSRIEQYRPPRPFGTVISRAFASLAAFVEACAPLCDAGTRILAMKGHKPGDELRQLPSYAGVAAITELDVPGLAARRHLISLKLAGTHARAND